MEEKKVRREEMEGKKRGLFGRKILDRKGYGRSEEMWRGKRLGKERNKEGRREGREGGKKKR